MSSSYHRDKEEDTEKIMKNVLEDWMNKGVLIAVSIPIFTSQLKKSRESVDMANLRDAFAVSSSAALTLDTDAPTDTSKIAYTFPADEDAAKASGAEWKAVVTPTQTQGDWQSTGCRDDIGGQTGIAAKTGTSTWTVSVKADGTVSIS